MGMIEVGTAFFLANFGGYLGVRGRGVPICRFLTPLAWNDTKGEEQIRYVDQIEIIENEFRIEKVYYIHASEQAETLWAEEYGKKGVACTWLENPSL